MSIWKSTLEIICQLALYLHCTWEIDSELDIFIWMWIACGSETGNGMVDGGGSSHSCQFYSLSI